MCISPMLSKTRVCTTSNGLNWDLLLQFRWSISPTSPRMFLIMLWKPSRNSLDNWLILRNKELKLWSKSKTKLKMLLKRLMTASRKMMRLELKQPKPNLTKPKRRKKTKKPNTSMSNPLNCQPPRRSSCFVVIPWVKTDKSAQKAENV